MKGKVFTDPLLLTEDYCLIRCVPKKNYYLFYLTTPPCVTVKLLLSRCCEVSLIQFCHLNERDFLVGYCNSKTTVVIIS